MPKHLLFTQLTFNNRVLFMLDTKSNFAKETETLSPRKHNRCLECKIRSHSFCRGLTDEKIEDFLCISIEKSYPNKQNIFLQEDEANHIYNITEGNIKIYKLLSDGRIQIIGFLYPGDFFGSYKNKKYSYSAEAIGTAKTCVFDVNNLDLFLEKNILLAKGLLHQTSHELTLAQDRISVLGKLESIERLATFILNISQQRERIGWQNNPISLPMTRQDIADYLGLTIETVSRCITQLKTTGVIRLLNKKQIFILDWNKLKNICLA